MFLHTIYLIAIVAQAMSGAIMGMRRGVGLFGICMISTATVLGGTMRDMMQGRSLGWIALPEYLLFTMGSALVTAIVVRMIHDPRKAFLLFDGLGLAGFTVIGCDIAMTTEMSPGIVVMTGMMTGIFGGVLRDVLCYTTPRVLRRELYVTVSLFTGALYVGLLSLKVDPNVAPLVSIGAGFLFRVLALRFNWQLPNLIGSGLPKWY